MATIEDWMTELVDRTGVPFGYAAPGDITTAEELGVPTSLLEFYEELNPAETMTQGKVKLHALDGAIELCTATEPGITMAKAGYFTFASTIHGDLYCLDFQRTDNLEKMRVRLFSHELEYEDMDRDELAESGVSAAPNLERFLSAMLNGTLPTDPFEEE